ncbi:cell division transport system permease protein [Hoeflea halophila]|uniref:Cell division transport system permease protein n=1 Tax=Hoeflea halophila TaxID=714899 RepID=A0A286IBA4_9HYPH|nr:ABC transporter permease [Hoeflea halophila]SOE16649.1 cell division transport system permease protein [Hoeflea halophila]
MTERATNQNRSKRRADPKRDRLVSLRPMAPIVPPVNVSGRALMVVIAIMSFLCALTLGAVTMVQEKAEAWQSDVSREITIQIKPDDGLEMETALSEARTIALSFPGTLSADIVDRAATSRLLEPWLGEGFDMDELPVPRLVIVTIDETAPPDFAAIRQKLAEAVPAAVLDDHRAWANRLISMARITVLIGVGILTLMFATTMLTVIFATRGVMAGNRHIVEVLHFVGAETSFIGAEFQKRFLLIGLKGAAAGGSVAALGFLLLAAWQSNSMATALNDQVTALFGRFTLSGAGYFGIVGIVILISAMTAVTTRLTVIRTIREIDRQRADPSLAEIG